MSKKLCIIPARGGSKRIPRKNIRSFLGKPIIAYSIEAALYSNLFDEVMVSTDNDEIANAALNYGACVPFFRSKKNSDDFATTADVILEVLDEYKVRDTQFDTVCCLYPTAPLIMAEKIKDAYFKLINEEFHSVLPIIPFSFPIQRALKINKEQTVSFIWPENEVTRSQDLQKTYHDAGQFYFLKVQSFLKDKRLITEKSGGIIISELEAQDIDNESDWKIAEIKYEQLQSIR